MRVKHVKKARKDHPSYGIKKGESYYWWKFNYGSKRVSKTYPKRSQLTQSEFYSQLYDLEDSLGELTPDESLADEIRGIAESLRNLGEECADKLSNMPDALQYAPTGELLQERADECESKADELDSVADDINVEDKEDDEEEEDYYQRKLDEALEVDLSIS